MQIGELAYTARFVEGLPGDARSDNQIRQVMKACYSRVTPTTVAKPELLALVPEVADLLDLDHAPTPALVDVLAGNRIVDGMQPYAACYGGHQFGNWAGQLGDGRAITLGEVVNRRGELWEMQLKGAGPTPYSRRADGRAVLRSSLRELVCSEAMHHLGVPTTRALSLVVTGEPVLRDLLYDGNPRQEPGAVVCRVAPTFLRFGNYEIHTSREDLETLEKLVRFTIERFYPQYARDGKLDIAAFFDDVSRRTAFLVSEWMRVGFVHGVMNTDNMSILGLTIDYGPYGWIEPFDLDWTPNITDASGRRYRFGAQAQVAQWNVAQLGRALAPIVDDIAPMQRTLDQFRHEFSELYRHTMLRKLGLVGHGETTAIDDEILTELGAILVEIEPDMTLFFRRLANVATTGSGESRIAPLREAFYSDLTAVQEARLATWLEHYGDRLGRERLADAERAARMDAVNPIYVPRNYLLQEVIEATEAGDRSRLPALLDVLRRPYVEQLGREHFTKKRPDWAREKPGCSMLSCSS